MGCKASATATVETVLPEDNSSDEVHVCITRRDGVRLGACVGNIGGRDSAVVIKQILDKGLVHEWNMEHPSMQVRPGMKIVKVNDASDYWGIIEELHKANSLDMIVKRDLTSVERFESRPDLAPGETLEASVMLKFGASTSQGGRHRCNQNGYTILPHVLAADCGTTTCSVCIDEVKPDEALVQLPCKHAYHAVCIGRWLASNQQQRCPLCARPVNSSRTAGPRIGAG